MTLQSSGPIKASEIEAEFNGTPPFRLTDYYAGGIYVNQGTQGDGGSIPSSGTIKFSDFYGASNTVVNLLGAILLDINIGGSSAGVGYRLGDTDGDEYKYQGGTSFGAAFNTYIVSGHPEDLECRMDLNSGNSPTSGDFLNVWLPVVPAGPGGRTWELNIVGDLEANLSNNMTISLRLAGSAIVIASAPVTMQIQTIPL